MKEKWILFKIYQQHSHKLQKLHSKRELLHAVSLRKPHWIHTFFLSDNILSELSTKGIKLFLNDRDLNNECDVVLTTGVDYHCSTNLNNFNQFMPNILVIHGSDDPWTMKYAKGFNVIRIVDFIQTH